MQSVYFDDSQTMSWVLGINDRNVSYLEILVRYLLEAIVFLQISHPSFLILSID